MILLRNKLIIICNPLMQDTAGQTWCQLWVVERGHWWSPNHLAVNRQPTGSHFPPLLPVLSPSWWQGGTKIVTRGILDILQSLFLNILLNWSFVDNLVRHWFIDFLMSQVSLAGIPWCWRSCYHKGFLKEICKVQVQRGVQLKGLADNDVKHDNLVSPWSVPSEASLLITYQMSTESLILSSRILSCHWQKCDVYKILTVAEVSFLGGLEMCHLSSLLLALLDLRFY